MRGRTLPLLLIVRVYNVINKLMYPKRAHDVCTLNMRKEDRSNTLRSETRFLSVDSAHKCIEKGESCEWNAGIIGEINYETANNYPHYIVFNILYITLLNY